MLKITSAEFARLTNFDFGSKHQKIELISKKWGVVGKSKDIASKVFIKNSLRRNKLTCK